MTACRMKEILGLMIKNVECCIWFCITEFLSTKQSVQCPLCKQPITKRSLYENPALEKIVSGVNNLRLAFEEDLQTILSPSTCRQCYLQDLPEVSEPYQDRSSVWQTSANVNRSITVDPGEGIVKTTLSSDGIDILLQRSTNRLQVLSTKSQVSTTAGYISVDRTSNCSDRVLRRRSNTFSADNLGKDAEMVRGDLQVHHHNCSSDISDSSHLSSTLVISRSAVRCDDVGEAECVESDVSGKAECGGENCNGGESNDLRHDACVIVLENKTDVSKRARVVANSGRHSHGSGTYVACSSIPQTKEKLPHIRGQKIPGDCMKDGLGIVPQKKSALTKTKYIAKHLLHEKEANFNNIKHKPHGDKNYHPPPHGNQLPNVHSAYHAGEVERMGLRECDAGDHRESVMTLPIIGRQAAYCKLDIADGASLVPDKDTVSPDPYRFVGSGTPVPKVKKKGGRRSKRKKESFPVCDLFGAGRRKRNSPEHCSHVGNTSQLLVRQNICETDKYSEPSKDIHDIMDHGQWFSGLEASSDRASEEINLVRRSHTRRRNNKCGRSTIRMKSPHALLSAACRPGDCVLLASEEEQISHLESFIHQAADYNFVFNTQEAQDSMESRCPGKEADCHDKEADCHDKEADCHDKDANCCDKDADCCDIEADCYDKGADCRDKEADCCDKGADCRDKDADCRDKEADCHDKETDCRDKEVDCCDKDLHYHDKEADHDDVEWTEMSCYGVADSMRHKINRDSSTILPILHANTSTTVISKCDSESVVEVSGKTQHISTCADVCEKTIDFGVLSCGKCIYSFADQDNHFQVHGVPSSSALIDNYVSGCDDFLPACTDKGTPSIAGQMETPSSKIISTAGFSEFSSQASFSLFELPEKNLNGTSLPQNTVGDDSSREHCSAFLPPADQVGVCKVLTLKMQCLRMLQRQCSGSEANLWDECLLYSGDISGNVKEVLLQADWSSRKVSHCAAKCVLIRSADCASADSLDPFCRMSSQTAHQDDAAMFQAKMGAVVSFQQQSHQQCSNMPSASVMALPVMHTPDCESFVSSCQAESRLECVMQPTVRKRNVVGPGDSCLVSVCTSWLPQCKAVSNETVLNDIVFCEDAFLCKGNDSIVFRSESDEPLHKINSSIIPVFGERSEIALEDGETLLDEVNARHNEHIHHHLNGDVQALSDDSTPLSASANKVPMPDVQMSRFLASNAMEQTISTSPCDSGVSMEIAGTYSQLRNQKIVHESVIKSGMCDNDQIASDCFEDTGTVPDSYDQNQSVELCRNQKLQTIHSCISQLSESLQVQGTCDSSEIINEISDVNDKLKRLASAPGKAFNNDSVFTNSTHEFLSVLPSHNEICISADDLLSYSEACAQLNTSTPDTETHAPEHASMRNVTTIVYAGQDKKGDNSESDCHVLPAPNHLCLNAVRGHVPDSIFISVPSPSLLNPGISRHHLSMSAYSDPHQKIVPDSNLVCSSSTQRGSHVDTSDRQSLTWGACEGGAVGGYVLCAGSSDVIIPACSCGVDVHVERLAGGRPGKCQEPVSLTGIEGCHSSATLLAPENASSAASCVPTVNDPCGDRCLFGGASDQCIDHAVQCHTANQYVDVECHQKVNLCSLTGNSDFVLSNCVAVDAKMMPSMSPATEERGSENAACLVRVTSSSTGSILGVNVAGDEVPVGPHALKLHNASSLDSRTAGHHSFRGQVCKPHADCAPSVRPSYSSPGGAVVPASEYISSAPSQTHFFQSDSDDDGGGADLVIRYPKRKCFSLDLSPCKSDCHLMTKRRKNVRRQKSIHSKLIADAEQTLVKLGNSESKENGFGNDVTSDTLIGSHCSGDSVKCKNGSDKEIHDSCVQPVDFLPVDDTGIMPVVKDSTLRTSCTGECGDFFSADLIASTLEPFTAYPSNESSKFVSRCESDAPMNCDLAHGVGRNVACLTDEEMGVVSSGRYLIASLPYQHVDEVDNQISAVTSTNSVGYDGSVILNSQHAPFKDCKINDNDGVCLIAHKGFTASVPTLSALPIADQDAHLTALSDSLGCQASGRINVGRGVQPGCNLCRVGDKGGDSSGSILDGVKVIQLARRKSLNRLMIYEGCILSESDIDDEVEEEEIVNKKESTLHGEHDKVSDAESDASIQLNIASLSTGSSQGEIVTTQERTKLETELERLRREIADMEAHLQHHPSSSSCKSAGRDSVSRHEAVVSLVDDCKDGNITINVRSGLPRRGRKCLFGQSSNMKKMRRRRRCVSSDDDDDEDLQVNDIPDDTEVFLSNRCLSKACHESPRHGRQVITESPYIDGMQTPLKSRHVVLDVISDDDSSDLFFSPLPAAPLSAFRHSPWRQTLHSQSPGLFHTRRTIFGSKCCAGDFVELSGSSRQLNACSMVSSCVQSDGALEPANGVISFAGAHNRNNEISCSQMFRKSSGAERGLYCKPSPICCRALMKLSGSGSDAASVSMVMRSDTNIVCSAGVCRMVSASPAMYSKHPDEAEVRVAASTGIVGVDCGQCGTDIVGDAVAVPENSDVVDETVVGIGVARWKRPGKHFTSCGLDGDKCNCLRILAKEDNCSISSEFNDSVTHVIMKTDPAGRVCDRTLKYVQGVAGRCWVLSSDWLTASSRLGHFLDEVCGAGVTLRGIVFLLGLVLFYLVPLGLVPLWPICV